MRALNGLPCHTFGPICMCIGVYIYICIYIYIYAYIYMYMYIYTDNICIHGAFGRRRQGQQLVSRQIEEEHPCMIYTSHGVCCWKPAHKYIHVYI